ncbi:MAG TPA: FGGY-family carbohydrate kinase, partial [Pseudodesulfovibrio sp.]|nr:FGGY-family carbohydrate kinase [Pseudodesulfovibrio sp.]
HTLAALEREGTFLKAHPITGNRLWPASAPVLLRWIKDHEPDVYRKTRHVLMVKDYIKYCLTGELSTDHTDFTGAALADLSRLRYENTVYDAYGIPEVRDMLPPMHDSWLVGGNVTPEAARETGLAKGTPVAVGGMDISMTVLGCGILNEGQMSIIVGTWSINGIVTERPVIHGGVHNSFSYAMPDRWYICDASPSSAANLDWFVDLFCYWERMEGERRGVSAFEVINEEIAGMNPQSCDILFHPFIYGSNVQASARAGFYGLGGWHKRADLLRAVFEGVCFSHLNHVEKLRVAVQDREAFIAGGGKRSEIWTQMFSDILNTPIQVPKSHELGALGCAITAAVAVGLYTDHRSAVKEMCAVSRTHEPHAESHDIYMKKYERYM